MKKFIKIVLLVLVLLIFTACNQNSKELDFEKPFTEKQVVNVLEENLGKMNKIKEDIEEEDKIEGVIPSIYQLEEDEGLIYIYVFDSLSERKKNGNKFLFTDYYPTYEKYYVTNNILIRYEYLEGSMDAWRKAEEINEVVIKKLNPYEEATFFGSSENWNGYYKIGYYGYFSNDDKKGTLVYEAWNQKEGRAIYKGEDSESDFSIDYQVSFGSGNSVGGTNRNISNGEINFGKSGGDGGSFENLEKIKIEIEWQGKKEEIILNKNTIEIKDETQKDIPKIVKEMAQDYVRVDLEHYNSFKNEEVVDAKITGLTHLETGTATENHDIQMWLLEYRILSESDEPLFLAGGMTLEDGWRTELSSAGAPIIVVDHEYEYGTYRKIGMTHTGNIIEEFDGDYSKAALGMYEKIKNR